jgi:hypothetical protein
MSKRRRRPPVIDVTDPSSPRVVAGSRPPPPAGSRTALVRAPRRRARAQVGGVWPDLEKLLRDVGDIFGDVVDIVVTPIVKLKALPKFALVAITLYELTRSEHERNRRRD